MRSEFIIQGKEQTLHMPYGTGTSRSHGSDGRNNGFLNLETNPEDMDKIHELRGFPELRECLETIRSNEVFRSLRCDSGKDQHFEKGFKNSCFAMLTVVFRTPQHNDLEWFQYFFNAFKAYADECRISNRVKTYFAVDPVVVTGSNFEGVCLDIQVQAYGYTSADARGQWKTAMRRLNESIKRWQDKVQQQERNSI